MSIKESLKRIQSNLESARSEIEKLYDLVESLEKTVGGFKEMESRPAPRKQPAPKAARGTATDRVLTLIKKNAEGISTDAIMKQTGLERRTVYGILNKAKKQKKLKSPKRGTYVMV